MKFPFLRFVFLSTCLLLPGCAAWLTQAEPPEVLVTNVQPLDSTIFEQRLQVDLRVRNPNDFALEVTVLDFTLELNGKRLARGLSSQAVTIPRLGDGIVSVETSTSTLDVVRQLLNLGERQDVTYQIKGVLHLQGMRLPFENEGVLFDPKHIPGSAQDT